MAALTPQTLALAASGLSITFNSCGASGDTFANLGKTFVVLKNGVTASCAVTFTATQNITDASLAVPDLTVSVSASTSVAVGPFPKPTFNNASSAVAMTYANSATLTIGVITHP